MVYKLANLILSLAVASLLTLNIAAQDDVPTFKSETRNAIVWDEGSPESGISSKLWDPSTGNEIHKLSYGGIVVSSRLGYERINPQSAIKLLHYVTTIANNTDSDVSVRYGGASVDGRVALPLEPTPRGVRLSKTEFSDASETGKSYCFQTGFVPREFFFSPSTQNFRVRPRTAVTISFVTKDPRTSNVLCSMDGCRVKGSARYYVTVDHRDFVFVWPGRSIVYCGE